MKPIYKWPGGKNKEINNIEKYFPEKFSIYIEPFFGGGAIYFYLNFNNNIINDLNNELTLFLNLMKNGKREEIYNRLKDYKNEENFYYYVRNGFEVKDEIDIATRFFYLRKTCFRGLVRYNKSGKFNVPFGNYKRFTFEELLNDDYLSILKNTKILNKDFSLIFNEFDNEDYFYFLDPPYHNTFSEYNSVGFDKKAHIILSELFKKSKSKCLMVIGETDFIIDLYKDYIVDKYSKKYSITNFKKEIPNSFHLIIKNF